MAKEYDKVVTHYSEGPGIHCEGPWRTVSPDRAGCGLPGGAESCEALSSLMGSGLQ